MLTTHHDKTLTRLMTGIFIANTLVPFGVGNEWGGLPKAAARAIQPTVHKDAYYMPAAIVLLSHHRS
jgi:hypothetical protein